MQTSSRVNLNHVRLSVISLSIAAALAGLSINVVSAQESKPAEKPEAGKLETMTVTAERRSENIKDVPSSISA